MKLPLISIITACYNSAEQIEQTILSVADQDYGAKELIIIDGASTDGTQDVIQKYGGQVDSWVSEPDQGIPDALNKGMARASGDWLYFLSSDDVLHDEHVLSRVSGHLKGRRGLVYGDVIMKSSGERFDGPYDTEKLVERNICHQAQFFHKSVFDRIGLYNTRYQYLSDWDLNLRIFADPSIEKYYIDEVICVFDDAGRTSYSLDKDFWDDRVDIFVERLRGVMPASEAAAGLAQYLYYSFKKGSLAEGTITLLQLLYYTRRPAYIKAALDNLKMRYR